jgi:hypothetical protein
LFPFIQVNSEAFRFIAVIFTVTSSPGHVLERRSERPRRQGWSHLLFNEEVCCSAQHLPLIVRRTISAQSVDLPGGLRCQLQPVESWLGADAICLNGCIACCIEYSIILLGLLTDEFCTFRILNNTR